MPHFDSRAFPPRAPQISTDHYDKAMGSACNNLAPHSRDCATIIYKVGMVRKGATRLLSKIQGGVLGEPSCLNMHLETGSSESAQPQIPPARFSQPREASPYMSLANALHYHLYAAPPYSLASTHPPEHVLPDDARQEGMWGAQRDDRKRPN